MREVLLEYSLNDKNDKLAVLKKAADEIFVPAATMKLALLGKVWGYDTLYESCRVRIIAASARTRLRRQCSRRPTASSTSPLTSARPMTRLPKPSLERSVRPDG